MQKDKIKALVLNFFALLIIGSLKIQIYTMQIYKGFKMPLAHTKIFEAKYGCTEIQIPNNYKKLILKLESNNLNRILVTDMKIDLCNENYNIKGCCSKNATFCMENSNPTLNEFHLNYCIDYTYIYACVNPDDPVLKERFSQFVNQEKTFYNQTNNLKLSSVDFEENKTNQNLTILTKDINVRNLQTGNSLEDIFGNIKVDADIKRGEGCTTAEYIPETECSTLGLANCRDQSRCNRNCIYVECRQNFDDPKSKVFSMCLPEELRDSEIEGRCKNHVAFKEIAPQPFKINCTNPNDINYVRKDSSHTFFKFLLVIFGVFLITLFITSIYYRYHCSNYKTEPFDPPSFCPNFVYPRASAY